MDGYPSGDSAKVNVVYMGGGVGEAPADDPSV